MKTLVLLLIAALLVRPLSGELAGDALSSNPNVLLDVRPQLLDDLKVVRVVKLPERLPDGRFLVRPFGPEDEPLPNDPPDADQIISDTRWLSDPLICGIEEGETVPVYAFPVWDGPIIDWIGLDDYFDYGLYLGDGWVMLYHPRWPESGGLGFLGHEAVAFPGAEEGEPWE